jgi:hypothetical protein
VASFEGFARNGLGKKFGLTVPGNALDFAADMASRNLVARGVAEYLMGLGGVENSPIPVVASRAVATESGIGLLMELAPGTSATTGWPMDPTRPPAERVSLLSSAQKGEFCRQTTWLHLIDYLTGQRDRSTANVFADFSAGGCRVSGIDNDLCLGTAEAGCNELGASYSKLPKVRPPHMDEEMAAALKAMTPDGLGGILRSCGRDPGREPFRQEWECMRERASNLWNVVDEYREWGRILPTRDAWQSEEIVGEFVNEAAFLGGGYAAVFAGSGPIFGYHLLPGLF